MKAIKFDCWPKQTWARTSRNSQKRNLWRVIDLPMLVEAATTLVGSGSIAFVLLDYTLFAAPLFNCTSFLLILSRSKSNEQSFGSLVLPASNSATLQLHSNVVQFSSVQFDSDS